MSEVIDLYGWTVRAQAPLGPGPHPLILMLHGLTGDESVMWIFASRLPRNVYLLAPRGLYPAPGGGFSWYNGRSQNAYVEVSEFRPAVEALLELLSPANLPEVSTDQIGLLGFSQGAALAYTLALTYPQRVVALAGMAGFMPASAEVLAQHRPLVGKTVFLAHGERDEIVPFERAQHAKNVFEAAGAGVVLCSDDTGHKLSANCFRGLQQYYATVSW